jgi:glycosyltransferase involved in cell wall biosynthesis
MKPFRLVIVETHPIQYKAPLFRLLAAHPQIDLTVLYAMLPDAGQQGAGYGVSFEWDVPVLEGYPYEVLKNRATHPAVNRFGGCDTPGIRSRLQELNPDAVLVNGWVTKTCLQALWACRRLGIPCLVRGEANLLRKRAWWKHALHRLLLRNYDGYLAIGSANQDFYQFHHCPEDRIFFAPYAVDNECFAAQAAERASTRTPVRERFGISSDDVVFLFAGKLIAKKNPMDFLAALAQLPEDMRGRAKGLVVGDGPLRQACEQFVSTHHLPVTFTGFLNQSRLPDAYAAADVLVLPSDAGETWGLVVNEAMASGCAAVVSRSVGCCADLIREGETGGAFALHDMEGLSRLLADYVAAPTAAKRQGEAARIRVQAYSYETIVQGILSALQAVVPTNVRTEEGAVC